MVNADKEKAFRDGLETGTRSLFLSACLLSDDERQEVRKLVPPNGRNQSYNGWHHLQLAVFLYDFFNKSDGKEYRTLENPIAKEAVLDYVWKEVYGNRICENEDEQKKRWRSIKTKCWILKEGPTSDVWKRLRDIIHLAKDNDADIESRCDVTDRDFFRLVDLLADGARADNIQQWQNKVPQEELEVWRMWVEVCNSHLNLSQNAYVDWYLQFDESGQQAQYVVGFDGFPDEEGGWRSFEISDQGRVDRKRIPTSSSWAEPIPWNRNITIKYGKTKWDTLKPNDRDPPVVDEDESCLFHSANEHLGVFVRYLSNEKDGRRNWWKRYDWDEQPELGSRQTDILVCGRDDDAISRLKLAREANQIELKLCKSGSFFISNENEDPVKIPFQIYSITNRPNDADVEIAICDGDREIRKVMVRGNSAHVTIDAGGNGFFVTSMGRDSHCLSLSDSMNLKVELPRGNNEYRWTLFARGVEQWSKTCQEVSVTLQEVPALMNVNAITPFTLRCEESAGTGRGRIIGRAKGIIIPDKIAQCLCVGSMQPEGWIIENVCNGGISPIADRIEGFRRVKIQDPTGTAFEIGVPDNSFKWWFEDGLNSFMDLVPAPVLLDKHSCAEEFSPEGIRSKSLCLPPDITCDLREWTLTSSYFRRRVDSLIDVADFRYDPEAQARTYRFPGSGIDIFRYRFEPKSVRLCADVNGRLGVYVPANDQSEYVAVAFSDTSADLLLTGRVIARICPDNRFTDIQNAWDAFCQDAEEHDALLAILEAKDGQNSIIYTNAITDKFDERLRLRKGVEDCVYGNAELSTVKVLKILLGDIPENHPVRKMHFFRTMQTQTSEQVRNAWRSSVATLAAGCCVDSGVWNHLFNEWLQSGFDPLVEGVAHEIYEMIRDLFMCRCPLEGTPFEVIDQNAQEWKCFLRKFLDSNRNLRDDDIRRLRFWSQDFKRTENRINAFRELVVSWRTKWREFDNTCLGKQRLDQNLKNELLQKVLKAYRGGDLNWRSEKIAFYAKLDNNAGQGETAIGAGMTDNCLEGRTPSGILSLVPVSEGQTDLSSSCTSILNLLSQRRRVGGLPSPNPTDREWLFCVAAATVLISENAVIDVDVREILAMILRVVRKSDELWQKFKGYQEKCYSISAALTDRQFQER